MASKDETTIENYKYNLYNTKARNIFSFSLVLKFFRSYSSYIFLRANFLILLAASCALRTRFAEGVS